MLDNKETTQNYFQRFNEEKIILKEYKIMEKDGAEDLLFVESRRNWAVRQLHYTVILTASRN